MCSLEIVVVSGRSQDLWVAKAVALARLSHVSERCAQSRIADVNIPTLTAVLFSSSLDRLITPSVARLELRFARCIARDAVLDRCWWCRTGVGGGDAAAGSTSILAREVSPGISEGSAPAPARVSRCRAPAGWDGRVSCLQGESMRPRRWAALRCQVFRRAASTLRKGGRTVVESCGLRQSDRDAFAPHEAV